MIAQSETEADEVANALKKARGVVAQRLEVQADDLNKRYTNLIAERDKIEAELQEGLVYTDEALHIALQFRADALAGLQSPTFDNKLRMQFPGLVLPFNHQHLLVYGPEAEALGAPLYGPPVYLSPGYRYFEQNEYLLPTEVIDDLGQRFSAPACYDWIEKRGDAFPRADLIGFTPSGQKKTVFMKAMDLAEMRVFASAIPMETDWPVGGSVVRLDLAIEAFAQPDGYALTPTGLPLGLLSRALPCYRLAPGVFGSLGAAIINRLLATGRRDWRLTFDNLDELMTEDG